jgi:preprotein translocase subunit Sec63
MPEAVRRSGVMKLFLSSMGGVRSAHRYRRLALKFHPDMNPEEKAKDEFLRICEAYDILSDREYCCSTRVDL